MDRYCLIIYPVPRHFPGLEDKLSAIARQTSLSVYDLRIKLVGFAPELLRRSEERSEIARLAEAIAAAGLPVACVAEGEVEKLPEPRRAHSLEVDDRQVRLRLDQGRLLEVSAGRPLFIAAGALGGGGDERMRAVRRMLASDEVPDPADRLRRIAMNEPIADIYAPDTGEVVTVRGNSFDYSGLGDRRTPSTALNFVALITLLAERSPESILELGFGLSTLPGCVPDPADREPDRVLQFFRRYSRIMYLCEQAGLYTRRRQLIQSIRAAGGGPTAGRQDEVEMGSAALPALPLPPERLRVGLDDMRGVGWAFRELTRALGLLGPLWFSGPLAGIALAAGVIGLAARDAALGSGAPLALGALLLYHGVELIARKRLIENTPTSRVRSLAMGFVEVIGKARQKYALKLPYLMLDCVYFRYRLYDRRGLAEDNRRYLADAGASGPVPFFVEDDTGRVLVDPEGAIVEAVIHEEIAGDAAALLGGAMAPGQMLHIDYITEGFTTYVFGTARPVLRDPSADRGRLLDRLRKLKRSPVLMEKYDTNRDGCIDESEWEQARRDSVLEIAAERVMEDAAVGDKVVIGAGRRAGGFYIRGEGQSAVLDGLRRRALMAMCAGIALFIAGFVLFIRALGVE